MKQQKPYYNKFIEKHQLNYRIVMINYDAYINFYANECLIELENGIRTRVRLGELKGISY